MYNFILIDTYCNKPKILFLNKEKKKYKKILIKNLNNILIKLDNLIKKNKFKLKNTKKIFCIKETYSNNTNIGISIAYGLSIGLKNKKLEILNFSDLIFKKIIFKNINIKYIIIINKINNYNYIINYYFKKNNNFIKHIINVNEKNIIYKYFKKTKKKIICNILNFNFNIKNNFIIYKKYKSYNIKDIFNNINI